MISRFPTARLKTRLVAMATEHGLAIVAVDPAYTSKWGAQHWRQPMTTPHRTISRHDAASIAIGRRALGHPIRNGRHRPTTTTAIVMGIGPPRPHQVSQGVREPAPTNPDHAPDARHQTTG